MPVTKPTLEPGVDFEWEFLLQICPGDRVYVGEGSYADQAAIDTALGGTAAGTTLSGSGATFVDLGEVQETPGKYSSTQATAKTRHHSVAMRRTTTFEMALAGISTANKDWLESTNFTGSPKTLVVASDDLNRMVVLNGFRWTADLTGQTDGVFQCLLKTEYSGLTKNKIVFLNDGEVR